MAIPFQSVGTVVAFMRRLSENGGHGLSIYLWYKPMPFYPMWASPSV